MPLKPALSVSTPFGPDKLTLTALSGEEGVCHLFCYQLHMVAKDAKLDFKKVIGKPVSVSLRTAAGEPRYLHGIVGRFALTGYEAWNYRYTAELRPWLWLLTHTTNCRIFQNLSIPDIIKKIFKDGGFTDVKDSLKGTYSPRDYVVQYNETACQFVSRLMEEEGIFYYFAHEQSKHTLVLADDPDGYAPCPSLTEAVYKPLEEAAWRDSDIITECALTGAVTTGAYAHTDYNFETPATSLLASSKGKGSTWKRFEYPGRYLKKADGEKRAKVRLEEQEHTGLLLSGTSQCRSFISGHTFTLAKHFRSDANGEYMLLRVSQHWSEADGYSNAFLAISRKTPFRPARLTPRPIIAGTQTAVVVGPSGKEIWTDKHGRIKVQFHWDQEGKKDDKSSCWVRVAHNWAGKQWGTFFLPRVGMEVVVSFLEGDPDQPLVTGAVYNGQMTLPYALPANQTRSTIKSDSSEGHGGFNEIRFEDKKDAEEIFVQAQKDMKIQVKNDRTKVVDHDEINHIKAKRTTTVTADETLIVADGNRALEVKTGTETYKVKGTRDLTVEGAETHTNKADFSHTADANYTLKIKGDLVIDVTGTITMKSAKSITTEAGTAYNNKSGTAFTNKAGTSLTNEAGTNLTNKAGASLTNDASASLTNKAGATMTNEASATLTSKGALHTVEASGIMTVKGAMVKIN